jgi:alpha-beta hydrolase superfamily lysophospholipase
MIADDSKGNTRVRFSRSIMIAAAGILACAAPCAANPTAQVALQVTPQRSTQMEAWVPDKVKGVVLFSTGHGSWPEKYDAIASAWKAAGFAVVAPVHVDSLHYPDREKFTREASFGERIADMKAASAYAARTWPGKPVIAAGHSFGTLTALCLGGGLANLGNFRDPTVKAVLGFSSPGRIPGLIGPDAYSGDTLPVMIVTGDQDAVPGLVTDWHDHLLPVQASPAGNKLAVTYPGATHELIGHPDDANYVSAASVSTDFIKAYGLGDRQALAKLGTGKDAKGASWLKR